VAPSSDDTRARAIGAGIIAAMSDRALPGVEGPPACPFVAFEDERDERSSSPDHRHRCYAEVQPAPRALAHQEAYCLSSAFPVCPTFQDWARREAAQARSSGRAAAAPPAVSAAINDDRESDAGIEPGPEADVDGEADGLDAHRDPDGTDDEGDPWGGAPHDEDEPVIHRNPPRDWAAPPPWATGGAGGGSLSTLPGGPPAGGPGASSDRGSDRSRRNEPSQDFLASREARGLAGSAADRLASGAPAASSSPRGASSSPSAPPSDELAGLVGAAGASGVRGSAPAPLTRPPSGAYPTTTASGRRPTVSSTRSRTPQHDGPSWESAKRYEAYPTIKTRTGLPGIPRIAVFAGALGVAALALFFLPALLGVGGGGGGGTGASPSPSRSAAVATASPDPTPIPEPTQQTYTIKTGDTLLKVAKKFGLTLDELLAANKDTIKNPDKIKVGQEIVIPVHTPDEVTDPSAATPTKSPKP
jgi:LysM repeat protein